MGEDNFSRAPESLREDVLKFALEQYGTEPDYPWMSLPRYAVLRHLDNQKWYGVVMDVPRRKLGLSGQETVDILNVKCDPVLGGCLRREKGFLPAYHMHRGNWLTVLLDGSVDRKKIMSLLEMSFDLTASRRTKKRTGLTAAREWIVPANPKYYDIEKAFAEHETILWKQSSGVAAGDTVYVYVAAPVSAILYKCTAVEVDIPHRYADQNISMSRGMKIKLLHEFDREQLCLEKLKEHGVRAVRGPRGVPGSLSRELDRLCGMK